MKRKTFSIIAGLALSTAVIAAVPHTFAPGDTIRAADMNENFAYIDDKTSGFVNNSNITRDYQDPAVASSYVLPVSGRTFSVHKDQHFMFDTGLKYQFTSPSRLGTQFREFPVENKIIHVEEINGMQLILSTIIEPTYNSSSRAMGFYCNLAIHFKIGDMYITTLRGSGWDVERNGKFNFQTAMSYTMSQSSLSTTVSTFNGTPGCHFAEEDIDMLIDYIDVEQI
jgi:hypothetical protein